MRAATGPRSAAPAPAASSLKLPHPSVTGSLTPPDAPWPWVSSWRTPRKCLVTSDPLWPRLAWVVWPLLAQPAPDTGAWGLRGQGRTPLHTPFTRRRGSPHRGPGLGRGR